MGIFDWLFGTSVEIEPFDDKHMNDEPQERDPFGYDDLVDAIHDSVEAPPADVSTGSNETASETGAAEGDGSGESEGAES